MEVESMSCTQARLLFWSPRVLCIGLGVFVSLFALDVFGEGMGVWQTALALAIHLIPTAILVAVLLIAWRWERVGAALFALAGALYAIRMLPQHLSATATIALPLLVIAGLFLANWVKRVEIRAAHS